MGWIFLILLIAGGVVAYQYLVTVEKEIRAEISAADKPVDTTSLDDNVESVIVNHIKTHPGILQTEIYKQMTGIDRSLLQKVLLELDRSGRILRKKSGNTYQLSSMD